ncbi:MAG: methyltransferase domain-containing protein [Deltaproteobacteria bacterium]|nr:methyltransferase domain-containing protein [Deltaproteobacteria bacterium]MCB9489419.1 methyltransferase domain-containing protein [Deltaproteobacteria bacterium]
MSDDSRDPRDRLEFDYWNPTQYDRFQRERSQPFYDLVAMLDARPGMRVLDLGCGTGNLTNDLHMRLGARQTIGIDTSAAMLETRMRLKAQGLELRRDDISTFADDEPFDLIFSNAALHWVDDHPDLFARYAKMLAPGGQWAVQVPANERHASHTTAVAVAGEAPFRDALGGWVRVSPVLEPDEYAVLLDKLGFRDIRAQEHVYPHEMPSTADVVEWVKGTTLTSYMKRLPKELQEPFVDRYRQLLLERVGEHSPYRFEFRRILMWAAR